MEGARLLDETQRLIGAIYETALSADGIGAAANVMVRRFEAIASWHYVMRPGVEEVYVASDATGFDDTAVRQYHAGMWREDYAVPAAQVVDRTFETRDLLNAQQQQQHPFARWLKAMAGSDRLIGRSVGARDGLIAGIALHFPCGLRRSRLERETFDRIAPHFGRASQLAGRLTTAVNEHQGLAIAVESLRQAFLLLDGLDRVVWANRSAHALLSRQDGISLRGSSLHFARHQDGRDVATAIARLRAQPDSAAATQVLAISRPSGGPSYAIELFLTPPSLRYAFAGKSRVLVVIHDPEAAVSARQDIWCAMYGLTLGEARVASGLQRGASDEAIAVALGIKLPTVRTHVRNILQKTGARARAELAHLLTAIS